MINHELKFIFIHVPRTGGTSIEWHWLEGWYEDKHFSAKEKIDLVGKKIWNEYFKFSFVRNPWDWMISQYKARAIGTIPYRMGDLWVAEFRKTLPDFIRQYRPFPHEKLTQSDYLNLDLDFVGKYENREKDLKFISEKIGFEISHKKRGGIVKRHGQLIDYWEIYNDESKKIVAEKFKEDIDRFGYEFGK